MEIYSQSCQHRISSVRIIAPPLVEGYLSHYLAAQYGFRVARDDGDVTVIAGKYWALEAAVIAAREDERALRRTLAIVDGGPVDVVAARLIGLRVVVSERDTPTEIRKALEAAARSAGCFSPQSERSALGCADPDGPAPLQLLLALTILGRTSTDIAQALGVSLATVNRRVEESAGVAGVAGKLELGFHLRHRPWVGLIKPDGEL